MPVLDSYRIRDDELHGPAAAIVIELQLADQGNSATGLQGLGEAVGTEDDAVQPVRSVTDLQSGHPALHVAPISDMYIFQQPSAWRITATDGLEPGQPLSQSRMHRT